MKKLFMIFSALAVLLAGNGCREEFLPPESQTRTVQVSATVRMPGIAEMSRAADEGAIRDVNLYLCTPQGRVVLHRYTTSATLRFECLPGNYMLRVAVNLGRDTPLADCTIAHRDDYDTLPMYCEREVTIPSASGGAVQLPALEVERAVAKVSYDISVEVPEIELYSVQAASIPARSSLFSGDLTPSDDPEDYVHGDAVRCHGLSASGTCYLLPNRQGTVASITDPRERNARNAPPCASYLLIRALDKQNRVLLYRVYLGENDTSDFNVQANGHYRFRIAIRGENLLDARVATYTVLLQDNFYLSEMSGYNRYLTSYLLAAKVESSDPALRLHAELTLAEGDAAAFRFDGESGAEHSFDLAAGKLYNFPIVYGPEVFTAGNDRLSYRITVSDGYGFSQRFAVEHRMADALFVHAGDAGGAVSFSDVLHTEPTTVGGLTYTLALCAGDGCRLAAAPSTGYRFAGWYADEACTQQVSASSEYRYVPASHTARLFARFERDAAPLDAEGTANCYIAPRTYSRYSFDATTMGNGRTTPGIKPAKLARTEARILWETGSERGAVLRSAEYDKGRIYFETGRRPGNALIGLFDAAGTCVWSWHIWSPNSDPTLYTMTSSTGAVFMDRNLGAETLHAASTSSRGFYYEWGRKDPFPWPDAEIVYGEGVAHDSFGPFYLGDAAADATIAWATAHPTTLMGEVAGPQDSWLAAPAPYLWGNGSDGHTATQRSLKSIYDPCPLGWRVPPSEAWGLEDFQLLNFEDDSGWYIRMNGHYTTYPFTGYLYPGTQGWVYTALSGCFAWSNTPGIRSQNGTTTVDAARAGCLQLDHFGTVTLNMSRCQAFACPVRCIKDE